MTTKPTILLSVTRVAEQLDCSRGHVYGLIAKGHLRTVDLRSGKGRSKARVPAADVERFITSRMSRA